jgi:hypothetical protein
MKKADGDVVKQKCLNLKGNCADMGQCEYCIPGVPCCKYAYKLKGKWVFPFNPLWLHGRA